MLNKLLLFLERSLAILFWVLLMLGFDTPYIAILTVGSAVIHECGHLIAALLFTNSDTRAPTGSISGFRIKAHGLSYKEELLLSLGGPMINIILGVLLFCIPFTEPLSSYMHVFALLNIMTAVSNLLPIESYDGYRAVLSAAAIFTNRRDSAEAVMKKISFAFSALMCFLSLYLILKLGEGYWIFAVFFTILLSGILKRQKSAI